MYYIEKTFEISASHSLTLSYESKCTRLHGHNWIVTVYCRSRELNADGMIVDFTEVKSYKAKVQESEGNIAIFEVDD